MKQGAFVVQQICNHGVSNAIVARCFFQWIDIIQWANLNNRDDLLSALKKTQDSLLSCYEIFVDIKRQQDSAETEWQSKKQLPPNTALSIPSILGLDAKVSHFLTNTKHVLRSLTGYFSPIFGDEPKAKNNEPALIYTKEASKWAAQKFGSDGFLHSVISEISDKDHPITHIRHFRDANEHPGGKSGHLYIHNFKYSADGLTTPMWHRNAELPTSIVHDMEKIIEILICASEHTLLACLDIAWSRPGIIAMYEIADEERDSEIPIKYKAGLHPKIKLPA